MRVRTISPRSWLVSLLIAVITIVSLLAGISYIVDPFFAFRVRDHKYKLYEWYVGPGLIKNFDYDTLIIGSSLTQNFNMEVFRKEMNVRPLHIGLGGINAAEIQKLINLAAKYRKAKQVFVAISMSGFKEHSESRLPQYLIDDTFTSKLRYLLSYEVWTRYIPLDITLVMLDKCKWELGKKMTWRRSIDHLGNWQLDQEFSENMALRNF